MLSATQTCGIDLREPSTTAKLVMLSARGQQPYGVFLRSSSRRLPQLAGACRRTQVLEGPRRRSRGCFAPCSYTNGKGDEGASHTTAEVQEPEEQPQRRIPQSLEEVDNGQIMGFGADLAEDHPGYHDQAYKDRRMSIANLGRAHRVGEPIPRLEYNADERRVWATVLEEVSELYPRHACAEFLRCFPLFNFRPDEVPQLEDMSRVLQAQTGWQVRPVAGLLHPRDFLNGLAFRTFHSTQYMRHPSRPSYTPEPDVCHELLGHVPMLADPAYCDLVHTIGVASLCADDKQIWDLTKIYWYTVEFGVVREAGDIKAFGAGVLSSYGELEHMASGRAELAPFDPTQKQPKMSYKDGYQKKYFVLESFEDGARKLREYCTIITPPDVMDRFMNSAVPFPKGARSAAVGAGQTA